MTKVQYAQCAVLSAFFLASGFANAGDSKPAADTTTYFACTVNETAPKGVVVPVQVKIAVKNLDMYKGKGELLQYPGSNEDDGLVSVEIPKSAPKNFVSNMTNLNGQGGDLRIEGSDLRLWGDGDGYQFTNLVIWDADEGDDDEEDDNKPVKLEGYVRDFGPTYGDTETFKQFIKCKRSSKKL